MKKLMGKIAAAIVTKMTAIKNDIAGSDTTEKVGMVVVAVIVVGILAAAVTTYMGGNDGLIANIFTKASSKLDSIFSSGT